eukprot:1690329-Heterocapsa_arctica.AAC.1
MCCTNCPYWTAVPIAMSSLSAVEGVTTGCVLDHVATSVPLKKMHPPMVERQPTPPEEPKALQ